MKSLCALLEGIERVLEGFESGIIAINQIDGTDVSDIDHSYLKILIPKQMLERLPIALTQVKAGSTSENILSYIRQFMYYLYQARKITTKVCNNITNSIEL